MFHFSPPQNLFTLRQSRFCVMIWYSDYHYTIKYSNWKEFFRKKLEKNKNFFSKSVKKAEGIRKTVGFRQSLPVLRKNEKQMHPKEHEKDFKMECRLIAQFQNALFVLSAEIARRGALFIIYIVKNTWLFYAFDIK